MFAQLGKCQLGYSSCVWYMVAKHKRKFRNRHSIAGSLGSLREGSLVCGFARTSLRFARRIASFSNRGSAAKILARNPKLKWPARRLTVAHKAIRSTSANKKETLQTKKRTLQTKKENAANKKRERRKQKREPLQI